MNMTQRPTDKQMKALRAFKIPEQEIQRYDLQQAQVKLNELISALPPRKPVQPSQEGSYLNNEPGHSKPNANSEQKNFNNTGAGGVNPASAPKPMPEIFNLTEQWLREAVSEIEKALGARPTTDSVVLAEIIRAKYGIWSIKRINKAKMDNIEAIQKSRLA